MEKGTHEELTGMVKGKVKRGEGGEKEGNGGEEGRGNGVKEVVKIKE